MDVHGDLYRYNAWANARVFRRCLELDPGLLTEEAPGTSGSIEQTLKHMVGVEDVYLAMLQGKQIESGGTWESYAAHDLAWFAERSAQLGDAYRELLATLDEQAFARPLKVPWFDFALTAGDGLLQVLSHSAQHRAQIFSVLGARGLDVPGLDYVLLRQETLRSEPN